MRALTHILVITAALFLLFFVPAMLYADIPAALSGSVDAVTHASTVLPEQPSGEFFVLLNKERFSDTEAQWRVFFSGGDAGVIMADINCLVIDADGEAEQLARRYLARLAENQMRLKRENGLLLVSKAESGLFDAIVISKEMAELYSLDFESDGIAFISVRGE